LQSFYMSPGQTVLSTQHALCIWLQFMDYGVAASEFQWKGLDLLSASAHNNCG